MKPILQVFSVLSSAAEAVPPVYGTRWLVLGSWKVVKGGQFCWLFSCQGSASSRPVAIANRIVARTALMSGVLSGTFAYKIGFLSALSKIQSPTSKAGLRNASCDPSILHQLVHEINSVFFYTVLMHITAVDFRGLNIYEYP